MAAGQVVFVSQNKAMVVVRHDDGFTVVELIGDEGSVAVGDRVAGDWAALGSEPLRTASGVLDAYFQGCWGSGQAATTVARNTGGG